MQTHLAGSVHTLVTCWKITRTDSTVKAFTDHVADLVVDAVTYLSASGYTSSPIRSTADMAVDNLDIFCVLDAAGVTDAELLAGLYDYAEVEIFMVNYSDLADGIIDQKKGWIGNITQVDEMFTAEFRGMTQALQQSIGELRSIGCRAEVGDTRCGVSLGGFTQTGTLTGMTDRANFADSGRSEADDYFNGGLLTWTGGNNSGLTMEVKDFANAGGTFQLQEKMPYAIQVGDTYSVYAGCDKSFAVCKATFSNVVNFRGEPHVPGQDQIMRFGGQ